MTDNIMLSVGAFTRMIAQIIGYTITNPDPIVTLPPFDLSTATIPTLRRLLDRGRVSSGFLVEVYLDQVLRHHFDIFTFEQGELMAQAHICDDTKARGHVVGPLGGIPVLVAMKAATYEQMKPDRKRTKEGVETPFMEGRGLVLGFLDENVLREVVKWERLEEGGTDVEICVVEGLAVVVRDVEGGR